LLAAALWGQARPRRHHFLTIRRLRLAGTLVIRAHACGQAGALRVRATARHAHPVAAVSFRAGARRTREGEARAVPARGRGRARRAAGLRCTVLAGLGAAGAARGHFTARACGRAAHARAVLAGALWMCPTTLAAALLGRHSLDLVYCYTFTPARIVIFGIIMHKCNTSYN